MRQPGVVSAVLSGKYPEREGKAADFYNYERGGNEDG